MLLLHEVHRVRGAREDDFEAAFRDRWMPELARGADARLLDELTARLEIPGAELVRGADGIAEGLPDGVRDLTLPKFRDGGLLIVHAGGGAGLFSAIIGGWASGAGGSAPVTKEIGS